MSTLFIADLHLSENNTHLSELFLTFLKEQTPDAKALYILGDLFAYWIGDDCQNAFQKNICAALNTASKKTPIYFMHGNRDFLIGDSFIQESNCQFLNEPYQLTLNDKNIILLHGDSLCLLDRWHQRFRLISQSNLIKKIFLKLPRQWREGIAKKIRQISFSRDSKPVDLAKWDIVPSEIPKLLKEADIVIHGHTHLPSIHLLKQKNNEKNEKNENNFKEHYVLSDWGKLGNVLSIDDNGLIELRYF